MKILVCLLIIANFAMSATVTWTDWTSTSGSTVTGNIGQAVTVTYSGEMYFAQVSSGTNYWNPTNPYLSTEVSNAPTTSDIIALNATTTKTLTFSQNVTGLYFAIVSLNANGYRFNQDFEILSYGAGYFGSGSFTKTVVSPGVYQLTGSGEVHGVIRFTGSFNTLSWTSLANETWNGFTIGVAVPEPATFLAILGAVILGIWKKNK